MKAPLSQAAKAHGFVLSRRTSQADGSDCRQAMHGAHSGARTHAWNRRCNGHARILPQAIKSYFGAGDALGMNIQYSVEESPAETAGSVKLASDELDETFLVISGDAVCDVDLNALIDFHRSHGASVAIGLKRVDNPLEFGIVVTDADG